MKEMLYGFRATKRVFYIVFVIFLFGCTSTPQHTNVLIFGTNTKIALDVSQDATGSLGATLGWRRQEAVWMPLLPNQAPATGKDDLLPAKCDKKADCPMFVGEDNQESKDTYSVLASFGSKLGGGVDSQGRKAQVTGEIAQYFATGLAARQLALSGGAGLVNTNGESGLTAAERKTLQESRDLRQAEFNKLVGFLTDPSDSNKIDTSRLDAALAKAPGKDIDEELKADIKAAKTMTELQTVLKLYPHQITTKPMLDTLTAK